MDAAGVYRLFTSYRLHFEGEYDISKSGYGNICNPKVIKELGLYKRLSNYSESALHDMFLAAFLYKERLKTPAEFLNDTGFKDALNNMIKRRDRFSVYYQEDLENILTTLDDQHYSLKDWLYGGGIFRWYSEKKVNIDTFATLDMFFHVLKEGDHVEAFDLFHRTFVTQYIKLGREQRRRATLREVTKRTLEARRTNDGY